ncbi:MAG: VanZ family protein [Defluviitaleaceae bacterium]|nr:VanZ family protein [Defluviitaleaceae bacterium]
MSKVVWAVLSVLIAVGIFFSSALSGEVSGNASFAIAVFARRFAPFTDEALAAAHFFVRKFAHFFVYLSLAFCITQSFKFYITNRTKLWLSAWGIASFYGVTDEIHQQFVPGRVMSFVDILINSCGALMGTTLVLLWLGARNVSISKNRIAS